MKNNKVHFFKNIAAIVIVAMFFYACTSGDKNKITANFKEVAQGVGRDVTIKHTDSGRLAVILKAETLKDYTHLDFPYTEFPDGLKLTIFDKEGGESIVLADYAIQYKLTHLVDLRGNVKITTADSSVLKAPQLYWNQTLKWAYTDYPYTIKAKNGSVNKGDGFDANQEFTLFKSRTNKGEQILKD